VKTGRLVVVGSAVILAVLGFYFAKSEPSRSLSGVATRQPGSAQAATGQKTGGHQHDASAVKPVIKPSRTAEAGRTQEEVPTVEISPEKQELIGVKLSTASIQPLKRVIRTVGLIEYDQRKLTVVSTKVEGWIEKLYVNYTGMYVKQGEPLADIYSPELWATQQEFINVVRWAKRSRAADSGSPHGKTSDFGTMLARDAEALVDAARQRLRLWDITDEQIRSIEQSERPIRTLRVYSPVSGYVLQKSVVEGVKVMAGEKLLEVTDLSTVWVMADIYEYELPLLKTGDTATIRLSYFPGRQFSSKIDYIYPTLSGDTRTAKARFVIPNPEGQLRPQMFTNIDIQINLGRKLTVPEDAVIDTGLRQIAYVDKGNGYFEPREVRVGIRADNMVEITAGLKAGEKVASAANFLVDSEAKLKGVTPLGLPGRQKTPGPQQTPAGKKQ
jgi:membrane fusion protein, copper/silver efflux system